MPDTIRAAHAAALFAPSIRRVSAPLRLGVPSICAFLLCALMGGGFPVCAFAGAPAFDLLAAAQVDAQGVYLHHVLASGTNNLPPIRVADAPVFGQAVVFTRAQLSALLQRISPGLATNGWGGAALVRVTRRARPLGETELRDLLTATLQNQVVQDKGDLELRFSRPWTPVNVPVEPLELKVLDLPVAGVTPNFIVRFEVNSGQDRVGPWQVVVQARLLREVLVARTNLKRGQSLAEADLVAERRDIISLREPLDPAALRDPGLELSEGLSAGQPLLARSVRQRPVIQRGQLVDAVMLDGALNITLKVEALSDGVPGQTVRVRNPKTKREFHAKVQNQQTVLLDL